MQSASRVPGQPAPVKIYNAVYSSVQVYECMVRGIAVMRRRADSYVNATQILKVAGVDKGRRTKILEKEILPGKHEIVQGGYGKYQGTWIPLERGRDIALQYGVAPLLASLFDFVPNANPMGGLSTGMSNMTGASSPRPLSAASSFSSLGTPANLVSPGLAPPPIMPGSALRLLNQGRAQGLFTPSTSAQSTRPPGYASPGPYYPGAYPPSPFTAPGVSPTPPLQGHNPLKRTRSENDAALHAQGFPLAASPDIQMLDRSRPPSTTPIVIEDGDNPSPTKRARTGPSFSQVNASAPNSPALNANSQAVMTNGLTRPESSQSATQNGKPAVNGLDTETRSARFATKPSIPRTMDPTSPLRDIRRAAIVTAICQRDDPIPVLDLLREIPPDNPALTSDVDLVLDDQGHTALHIAASMARNQIVESLISSGADIHRGNYNGETPLVRSCLSTQSQETQTFHILVAALHPSIRTIDTARKSVVHHIVATAGVKGRALAAQYYIDQIFLWVAQRQGGDFRSLVDLQDEHGDTALNIAARVGNRQLVRTLLNVGANRILPNKLGLRPGDFGVEPEAFGNAPRAEDILSTLRSGPSGPVLKSQDVLADMEGMIHGLSAEFALEIKTKQDQLDVTQAHLRAATRSLSEQRKEMQLSQTRCSEMDLIMQRIKNLEKAIVDEDNVDWSGHSVDLRSVMDTSESTLPQLDPAMPISFSHTDPTVPMSNTKESLIRLRRLNTWHKRMEKFMEDRLRSLQGASAEKEFQCKKILALSTGIPFENIEEMLDNLVVAMESEAQILDISRVSGFMQKVKNGVI